MKVLINKKTDIDLPKTATEDARKITYTDLIQLVSNTTPQGGFGKQDIKARIMIDGACEKVEAGGEILLENADAEYLQNAVKNQKWGTRHKDILAFIEDIETMPVKK